MKLIQNSIGWQDEDGIQLAYNEEWQILNSCRHLKFKRPIFKSLQLKKEKENLKNQKTLKEDLKDEWLNRNKVNEL